MDNKIFVDCSRRRERLWTRSPVPAKATAAVAATAEVARNGSVARSGGAPAKLMLDPGGDRLNGERGS
jgi:hypothetical protein